ncbi:putative phage tail assembly chaperone [Pseudomonas sp. MWU13-2105]|uniref:putative phage tail assembly chaperone n=1 Tax=Pseudomonas sp. MWU13-2105 TaxID=2935074 RepID=UPI00298CABEE|nr:putative phage tail assembly chaperone [Pseudomonas sp. MWU13-2105]
MTEYRDITLQIGGQDFILKLAPQDVTKYFNAVTPNNKVAPSNNLLTTTVKPDQIDTLRPLLRNPVLTSIACVVIIGLKPTDDEKNQGFEQYRHSLQGVHVVTFDELVERLQSLYNLLAGGAGSPVTTLQGDEAPF